MSVENVYVIYDRTGGIALKPPMVEKNDVVPIRALTQAVANQESMISKWPKEFELIHIGMLNLETMELVAIEPRLVAVAVSLLPEQQN